MLNKFKVAYLGRSFIFAILLIFSVTAGTQQMNTKNDIQQSINVIAENGRAIVHLKFTNVSSHDIYIPKSISDAKRLSGGYFEIAVNGKSIDYSGIMVKRTPLEISDYRVIGKGQEWFNSIDITDSYDFMSNSNEYTIKLYGKYFDPVKSVEILANIAEAKFVFVPNM